MLAAQTRVQRASFSANVRTKAATRVQARSPIMVRAAAVAAEVRTIQRAKGRRRFRGTGFFRAGPSI